jgi:hypothetical protein
MAMAVRLVTDRLTVAPPARTFKKVRRVTCDEISIIQFTRE